MESDQPEIKVIAPLHEMPPLPTTENIMKTLNSDKEPNENKTVTETETETRSLSLMSDFRKDAKGNGNEADLGQDTKYETEKKDAKTEENKMNDDDDEAQQDTLELRTVNEILSPVADLGQDTKNETEKNAGDPKRESNVSEPITDVMEIRDQGGGGGGNRKGR